MKEFAKTFYKSKRWQRVREAYAKSVGFLCEECLKKGKYTPIEEVHHKTPLTPANIGDPSVTLNFDNLEGLCRECHRAKHSGQEKRYKVDSFGHIIPL